MITFMPAVPSPHNFTSIEQVITHIATNKHNPILIFSDTSNTDLTLKQLNTCYTLFLEKLEAETNIYVEPVINELKNAYYKLWKKLIDAKFEDEKDGDGGKFSIFRVLVIPFQYVYLFVYRLLIICMYIIGIGVICYGLVMIYKNNNRVLGLNILT